MLPPVRARLLQNFEYRFLLLQNVTVAETACNVISVADSYDVVDAPRALAHEPAMMAPCFGAAPARRAALERRDDTPTEADDDVDRDETAANVKPARSHPALDIGPHTVS